VKARLYRGEAWCEGVEVRLSIQQSLMRSAVQYALAQAAKSQKSLAEGRARVLWRTSSGSHGRSSLHVTVLAASLPPSLGQFFISFRCQSLEVVPMM
jgi:uncharacterized protein with beta-barrel porin domain